MSDQAFATLAISGGRSVRQARWPSWPRADENTEAVVLDVLRSGRWAISGMYNGEVLYERRFSEAFANYNRVSYCVTTCNGSAALDVALEALGIGFGDEVLVPGVTWVACASAVIRVGATPVLVDIDPSTLCMSAQAARRAVTPRTAGIILVHLYCTVADLDAFTELSRETGIPIIEDCSQAHGALWNGRRVGSYGHIGVFSMQDGKVLTCGEGGAAVTDDPQLYDRLQQLRADGRRYTSSPPELGFIELEEVADVQGFNFCLSEFQSAILLDRLRHLDADNAHRSTSAEYLISQLLHVPGVSILSRDPRCTVVTYYHLCLRFDSAAFGNQDISWIRNALQAELQFPVEMIDAPLNANKLLLQPHLAFSALGGSD